MLKLNNFREKQKKKIIKYAQYLIDITTLPIVTIYQLINFGNECNKKDLCT